MAGGGGGAGPTTELLVETASAWVYTGELPSPRIGPRGANIDNKVLMTGNLHRSASLDNFQFVIIKM